MNLKTCFSDYGKEVTMDNFKPVDFVRGYCYKILPLVYDDSLSYYEVLCKVKKALNEVIENVNNLPAYIEQLIKEYITSGAIDEIIRELLGGYMLNVKYPPKGITPAVGDGTADDTEAIQGCIDYAQANGYGAVYFPSGKYLSQPITLKSNVGLYGNDRYSTSIICRGGANKALLNGNIHDVTIANLTLDGNDGFQVNEINCMEVTAKDLLLVNLICVDSSTHMIIAGNGGHLQMDNIIYKFCIFNGLTISGNINVQASHLLFTEINATRSRNVINIGTSNGTFDFTSNAAAPVGMLVTGSNNDVKAVINGASKTFTDTGSNNNINIISKSISQKITGDKTVYAVNSLENVTGDKTIIAGDLSETAENITVNATKNMETDVNNVYTIIAKDLILNPTNPLTYRIPSKHTNLYNTIPMKDYNGNPYNVLTESQYSQSLLGNNMLNGDLIFRSLFQRYDNVHFNNTTPCYSSMQGGCYANDHIVICYPDVNPNTYKNNGVKIIVYNLDGTIAREKILNLGHCNDITYRPSTNELYVAPNEGWVNGVYERQKVIYVLDFNTLNLKRSIPVVESVYGICIFKDEIICGLASNSKKFVKVNASSGAFTNFLTITDPTYTMWPPTYQTLATDGYNFYTSFAYPNAIFKFSPNGTVINIFDIPELLNTFYRTGEIEWFDIGGPDEFYAGFLTTLPGDIYNGIVKFSNRMVIHEWCPNFGSRSAYVNNNNTNPLPDGSQNNPFKELSEALFCLNNVNTLYYITMINNNKPYHMALTYNVNARQIAGGGSTIEGIQCFGDVRLDNLIITNNNTSNKYIYTSYCNVKFSNITFKNVATHTADAIELNNGVFSFGVLRFVNIPSTFIKCSNAVVYFTNQIKSGRVEQIFGEMYNTFIFAKASNGAMINSITQVPFEEGFTNVPLAPIKTLNYENKTFVMHDWITPQSLSSYRWGRIRYELAGKNYEGTLRYIDATKFGYLHSVLRDPQGIYYMELTIDFNTSSWSEKWYNINTNEEVNPRGLFINGLYLYANI